MGSEETTTGPTAARTYLEGVRAALADLPAAEVDEILDDVRGHLDEIVPEIVSAVGDDADVTASLTKRLGTPADYAAELRAAAGYPEPATAATVVPSPWPARWALGGMLVGAAGLALGLLSRNPVLLLIGVLAPVPALAIVVKDGKDVPAVAALPVVRRFVAARPPAGSTARAATDFVASLQPAWWLLRALIAGILVGAFVGDSLAAVVVVVVGIPVSVWLGYASKRDRRWLWLVVPLNALAVAILPFGLAGANLLDGPPRTVSSPPAMGLYQDDGRPIRDIRPVDASGTPLTGVYLFDQDGRPIDAPARDYCYDPSAAPTTGPDLRPYPRGTTDEDPATGRCRAVPPGPLVVAVPQPTPSAATTAPPPTSAIPTPLASPVPATPTG